jgi:hypothetical protein
MVGRTFTAFPPSPAWHGTRDPDFLRRNPVPPARLCSWNTLVPWRSYDAWMSGGPHPEPGLPYANYVWVSLGLRYRATEPVPSWAAGIRSHADLADRIGYLFVTDSPLSAERNYGLPVEIDPFAPQILDVLEDPHVRTHRGWMLLIEAGAPFPLAPSPSPAP